MENVLCMLGKDLTIIIYKELQHIGKKKKVAKWCWWFIEKEIQISNKCKKRSSTNEKKFVVNLWDPTFHLLETMVTFMFCVCGNTFYWWVYKLGGAIIWKGNLSMYIKF